MTSFARSESMNVIVTAGPAGSWRIGGPAPAGNCAGSPGGHASEGLTMQMSNTGKTSMPPVSPPSTGGSSDACSTTVSPASACVIVGEPDGETDGETDGEADSDGVPDADGPGDAESPGAGVLPGPPGGSGGIGTTSGPTTCGGTPPGGKAHIAAIRSPPHAAANASTIDAGHQSPW